MQSRSLLKTVAANHFQVMSRVPPEECASDPKACSFHGLMLCFLFYVPFSARANLSTIFDILKRYVTCLLSPHYFPYLPRIWSQKGFHLPGVSSFSPTFPPRGSFLQTETSFLSLFIFKNLRMQIYFCIIGGRLHVFFNLSSWCKTIAPKHVASLARECPVLVLVLQCDSRRSLRLKGRWSSKVPLNPQSISKVKSFLKQEMRIRWRWRRM